MAPVKPSRLTPRLPQSPYWSISPRDWGTGSTRVRATSECLSPATRVNDSKGDVAVMTSSLRRHYPDKFNGRWRYDPLRPATLSARYVRAPVGMHPQLTSEDEQSWSLHGSTSAVHQLNAQIDPRRGRRSWRSAKHRTTCKVAIDGTRGRLVRSHS